ncbi:MAG: hypothetical protein IJW24_02320 [Clostridia bacterium]|nr:hypothetical protein [Clostridia bacterium]
MGKTKKGGHIILKIIGIVLIIAGAIIFIKNATAKIPSMGDDGWFNASSKQAFGIFGGVATCMVGIFVLLSSFATQKAQNFLNKTRVDDSNKNIFDEVKDNNGENQFCDYCGSQLPKDEIKCESCGAVKGKK